MLVQQQNHLHRSQNVIWYSLVVAVIICISLNSRLMIMIIAEAQQFQEMFQEIYSIGKVLQLI